MKKWILSAALASAVPSTVSAVPVYNSGGFESPRFLNALALENQDPAVPFQSTTSGPWQKDIGTGTSQVQTGAAAYEGLQGVLLTRPASAAGDTHWYVEKTSSQPIVTIDVAMNVTQNGVAPPNNTVLGPAFGIQAFDGPAGSRLTIAGLVVDAADGTLMYQQPRTAGGALIPVPGADPIDRGVWSEVGLLLDFTEKEYTLYVAGSPIFTTPFVDVDPIDGINGITAATMTTTASDAAFTTQGGSAYYDNFVVNEVPEPTSMAAMSLVGLGLLARRRRASAK